MVVWLGIAQTAHAEWVNLTNGLDEANIRFVTADVRDPKSIYAASDRHLYRSADAGQSWKRVLSMRGETSKINFVLVDPLNPKEVYVATDKGVRVSREGGKKWEVFYSGIGELSKRSLCLAVSSQKQDEIFIGTTNGLILANKKTREAKPATGFPREAVYSIFVNEGKEPEMVVTTDKGIYRKNTAGFWERVFVNPEGREDLQETSLDQFEIEEVFTTPFFSNLGFLATANHFYAGTRHGVLEADQDAGSWSLKSGQNLPDRKVNAVTSSRSSLYLATDQGVFKSDPETDSFISLNDGLESKEVNFLFYNSGGDYLMAATKRGVFKYVYPELEIETVIAGPQKPSLAAEEVLKFFQSEPTIRQVQEVAVRYAEVHPDKIERWRKAAAMKAYLPTVSVDMGLSADENIDLDRGGTNDPDTFIIGPQEKSHDWSVGLNWDLGEMIWNGDQTSIDTRSRLMVELRDDILNQVTHLYYERRRLQVEMALSASRELPIQIDKEIRLQELTAGIDALTGGYFSESLVKNHETSTLPPS